MSSSFDTPFSLNFNTGGRTWYRGYRPPPDDAENIIAYLPRYADVRGRVPMVYCHGAGGIVRTVDNYNFDHRWILGIVNSLQTICLYPDLHTQMAAGTDPAIQAVTDAINWSAAKFGTRTDKVIICGGSMGGCTGLNWMWRNPDKVFCSALTIPLLNLQLLVADNLFGFGDLIIAEYGGLAAYNAALPTHAPEQNWDLIQPFADRLHVYQGIDDALCKTPWANEFAAETGCVYTVVPNAGHDHYWDTASMVRWLRQQAIDGGLIRI